MRFLIYILKKLGLVIVAEDLTPDPEPEPETVVSGSGKSHTSAKPLDRHPYVSKIFDNEATRMALDIGGQMERELCTGDKPEWFYTTPKLTTRSLVGDFRTQQAVLRAWMRTIRDQLYPIASSPEQVAASRWQAYTDVQDDTIWMTAYYNESPDAYPLPPTAGRN